MNRLTLLKLSVILLIGLIAFPYAFKTAYSSGQTDQSLAVQVVAIFESQCIQCHGAGKMSGLDLRTSEGLLKGGSRGQAVKPGDAINSLLYRFLTGQESPRMPLGGEMPADQIETIRKWIDQGANWQSSGTAVSGSSVKPKPTGFTDEQRNYWAFKKPVRSAVPAVKNSQMVKNPIDAFVLKKLEDNGLSPSALADKRTLLRRVTFDLTGLPPTPDEIKSFLADKSPEAYTKVVRRLLASPRYGERWAQHWLDVVRFGETNGFELDQDREQSWRYRDYVIKSLNEDKPYDKFILEQIAGDEIAPDSMEMRIATGFLRAGPQHVVAGNQDLAQNRQEWLTEVMFGVGNGIMGLTVGCARCHDHKFDPILQADFYRIQAFFAASDNLDFSNSSKAEEEANKAVVDAHKQKLKPITDQIEVIEKPYNDKLKAEKRAKLEAEYARALDKDEKLRNEEEKRLAKDAERMLSVSWDELVAALNPEDKEKRAELRRQMHKINLYEPDPLPKALAVSDVKDPVPKMHILKGGDPHRLGSEVEPGFLSVLLPGGTPLPAEIKPVVKETSTGREFKSTGRRLTLAQWLISPDHPLTARVMVNRLWHYYFGKGIVASPNDFGRNGRQPTHPELLDYLAVEFIENGWSLKHMHEMIVMSRTYQQSSATDERSSKTDPDNKLLWRMNRKRLDAEAIRDAVMFASGTYTEQFGGPSVRVPLDPEVYDNIFTEHEPDNLWPVHPDMKQHTRRTLYLVRKRNVRLPLLVAYDAPDMMSSCGARSISVHALQALTLMNSRFMFDQSRAMAHRLFIEVPVNTRSRINRLFELTLGRRPDPKELQMTEMFLADQAKIIRQKIKKGEAKPEWLPKSIDAATAAAWVDLCLATMNLNEFIYLR